MRKYRHILLALISLLSLSGGIRAQDEGMYALDFHMSFVPNIQFAPLYVAAAAGYFADEGIELRQFVHQEEPLLVERLALGDIPFAIIGGEQVISARAQERPLVMVYEWFQRYPIGLIVAGESDIHNVRDLVGLRVGIPGRFGASYSGLVALLATAGLPEEALQIESIGYHAPEVFCAGQVAAAVIYLNNEPIQIAERAAAGECGNLQTIRLFPVSAAADLVSNGIVTHERTSLEEPEKVDAVLRAFDRGLRAVIANPAAAYLQSAPYIENLPLSEKLTAALAGMAAEQRDFLAQAPTPSALVASRERQLQQLEADATIANELTQFRILLASIALWESERLGYSELASWKTTAATLRQMGFLSGEIDLAAAFTNDHLPTQE